MKAQSYLTALIGAVIASGVPMTAIAAGGTITFNGELTATTCSIGGDGADKSVTLPTVSTSNFSSVGDTQGQTGFNITLTGCNISADDASADMVAAYFRSGSTVDVPNNRTLRNTADGTGGTAATGVNIQLVNSDGNVIQAGSPVTSDGTQTNVTPVQIGDDGSATLNYAAQYYATVATPTAGVVTSTVDYTLVYP